MSAIPIPPNVPLVPGTVARIMSSDVPIPNQYLQIIFCKAIENDSTGQPRYKVALSDSVHFVQAVALSPLKPLFESKTVDLLNVIKVTKYSITMLKNHIVMLIGEIDTSTIIKCDAKYGSPINIESDKKPTTSSSTVPISAPNNSSIIPPPPPPPAAAPYTPSLLVGSSSYNGRPGGLASAEPSFVPPPPPVKAPSFQQGEYQTGSFTNQMSSSAGKSDDIIFTPICGLTPYQNTFVIKARCTFKSEIRTWAKEKSKGKLFSINLIDGTGEIKMTGFNDTVDKFFDLFQVGQVYTISGATVKMANKRFSNIKNDYELFLEGATEVQMVADSPNGIPTERFSFVPIGSLNDFVKDDTIDVIGIAHDVGDLGNITVKSTGKQLSKRDVTLLDKSGHSVRCTLWGKEAEDFTDYKNRAVIAIKHARVSDYNGRTLSTLSSSVIIANPDIPEAHELRGWYDAVGYSIQPTSMSVSGAAMTGQTGGKDDRKLIAQIKEESLGQGEKPDYASIIATITYIRSEGNLYYTACPSEDCNKKVIEEGPNMYRCERCNKVFDRCEYRYILSVQVSDESGQTWLNVFNETGNTILGVSAEELHRLKLEDEEAFKKVFEHAQLQPFLFKLRVKQEQYQGEAKIRNTVVTALPVNHTEESKRLIEKLDKISL